MHTPKSIDFFWGGEDCLVLPSFRKCAKTPLFCDGVTETEGRNGLMGEAANIYEAVLCGIRYFWNRTGLKI